MEQLTLEGAHDPEARPAGENAPLVVDLDGTLVRTDLAIELLLSLASRSPLAALLVLIAGPWTRAGLKGKLATTSSIDAAALPYNKDVLDLARAARAAGREVYLATAAHIRTATAVADHLQVFDGVLASDDANNLRGEHKAKLLVGRFGRLGFDYIGDARADLPVWNAAGAAYVAGSSRRTLAQARRLRPTARAVGWAGTRARDYLRALRPHQWLKNLLVFAPALAAHRVDTSLVSSFLAFISFSLCASGVYVFNDLLDLQSDRRHARKRFRPFAAGLVPLTHGLVLGAGLIITGVLLALPLPSPFALIVLGYVVLTTAYSTWLKRKMMVDVIALACLYGMRILAGAAAIGVTLSPWLSAFAIFLFFSLAVVKRCTEIIDSRTQNDKVSGRGYFPEDLSVLQSMSTASGFVAVLVLALYINSTAVQELYSHPDRLWFVCLPVLFWLCRMMLMSHRGHMHDDPIVFAARDRVSQLTIASAAVVILASL